MKTSVKLFLFKALLIIPFFAASQDVFWTTDIAPLLYNSCSPCHHDGGAGPFPIMSYEDATNYGYMIHEATEEKEMPPWPADPEYRHFKDENYLTDDEIMTIAAWFDAGMPFGDPELEPEPPVFPENGSLMTTIDFSLTIEPYTLQTNNDEYRWFVFENPYDEPIYINKIEVIPTLTEFVHHADISYDLTGQSMEFDLQDPLSGFNGSTGSPIYSYYMNAWQPGANIAEYPENFGILVPPNADFVFEIHYGPGGIGQTDETTMNFELLTETSDAREIKVGWLLNEGQTLIDGPIIIPPNQIVDFHHDATFNSPLSLISICPHMHLLGKSFKVWMEDGTEYTPLINIPQWDFHWQKYYTFQQLQVVPVGAHIKSEAVYDNTLLNPDNPHDPPIEVTYGGTTLDEMCLVYFIYTDYEVGDEDVILDSTLLSIQEPLELTSFELYPNPSQDVLMVEFDPEDDVQAIFLYSENGRLIRRIKVQREKVEINVSDLALGTYLLEVVTKNNRGTQTFIKH